MVEGPPHLRDRDVWGAGGGDVGFTRDGTHAEFIVLPEDAVALRPHGISAPDAAASGIPYVAAWLSLVGRARVTRGDWVLVSGAAGSVGTAATSIAKYAGARVIALVKDAHERKAIDGRPVDAIAQFDAGEVETVVRESTGGKGCDIALNVVGAPIFAPLLSSLADGGRMAIISGVAGRVLEQFDLLDFYRRDLSILGINTASPHFTVVACARILTELHAAFEAEQAVPIRASVQFELSQAPQAYERLASSSGEKIVFTA